MRTNALTKAKENREEEVRKSLPLIVWMITGGIAGAILAAVVFALVMVPPPEAIQRWSYCCR